MQPLQMRMEQAQKEKEESKNNLSMKAREDLQIRSVFGFKGQC